MAAAAAAKGKRAVICISSEDDDEEEEEEEEEDDDDEESEYEEEEEEASESEFEEEPESEEESDEEDLVSEDGIGSSGDDDEYDDDEVVLDEDDDDDDDDTSHPKGKPTDEDHYKKIINLLRGRKSLNSLKLEECKAYMRKHELRISGTKETCIKRILEHWRIKDGNGEKLHPESSFVINCTGDVCRGDVVLFQQRVYEKYDVIKRGGGAKIIGKRVIAGRVVKESYGDAKQQHTFSIDVLWSKGVKPLPPLFPLLVKGRNLYRHRTFRQPWSNEGERSRVLAEKHSRGAAARHVRAVAKALASNKGSKHKKRSSGTKEPPKKKMKLDLELASRKVKKNCTKKLSSGDANRRKVPKKSNVGPSAARGQAKAKKAVKKRNSESFGTNIHAEISKEAMAGNSNSSVASGQEKTKKAAKLRNSEPSGANIHAKMSGVPMTGNSNSSATFPEQLRHHPRIIQREYPYPQRYTYYDYDRPPAADLYTNSTRTPQPNHEMHHLHRYNVGHSTAAGVPHGYMHRHHDTGYNRPMQGPMHVHGPDRAGYISHPYGNPASHPDRGRQVFFDDRASGAQFHGWRRP